MILAPQHRQSKRFILAIALSIFAISKLADAGNRDNKISLAEENVGREVMSDREEIFSRNVLSRPMTVEEAYRLRNDLNQYSKSYDAGHLQLEEARKVMRQRLQERFQNADTDNDGSISRIEATESMPQVARHFSKYDMNNDGEITIPELEATQSKIAEKEREEAELLRGQAVKPEMVVADTSKKKVKEKDIAGHSKKTM